MTDGPVLHLVGGLVDLVRGLVRRVKSYSWARISKNALALLIAQMGARVLNLLLIAQVTRILGVAGLGRYLLAVTVESVALAIVDLGLNTFVVRELAGTCSASRAEILWGGACVLKLLAALCGVLVLNGLVAPFFFPGERRALIAVVSWALIPESFNGLAAALIRSRQRMEISSAVTLVIRLLIAAVGVWLVRYGYDERALLVAYGAINALGSIVLLIVLRVWHVRARWTLPGRVWLEILRESMPFAVTGMVAMLYTRIDLLMLSYWQGDVAAGLYGAAYRLWEALGMIPSSFLDALFPELSRLGSDRPRLRSLYRRGRTIMWGVIAGLIVPSLLVAPYLVSFLYGSSQGVSTSTHLFRLLLFVFPFTCLYLLNGHVLYAGRQQRHVTAAMVAVTAINGLLNALVIPLWSYWGAAGVALLSEVLLFAALEFLARRLVLAPSGGADAAGRGRD